MSTHLSRHKLTTFKGQKSHVKTKFIKYHRTGLHVLQNLVNLETDNV